MKKTTKFLLVLAAVVAMTIGAMSTVMAADYPSIAEWIDVNNDGKVYQAKDADGNLIRSGWAVADSGIYYYFSNSTMQTNRFVTTGGKTYFVNADGAMHTGWFEFNDEYAVNVNGAAYDNVADAFGDEVGTGEVFEEDSQYETIWLYFDEVTGAMYKDAWAQTPADGIWYYMDGPFCVMNEKKLNIIKENGKQDRANYGFDASGAMLAGWIAYVDKADDTTTGVNTPFEKTTVGASTTSWAYYGTNGQLAGTGWLKDANGDWFYMEANNTFGVPTAMTATYLSVENGDDTLTFYFNDGGYMETGVVTLPAKKNVAVKNVAADGAITTGTAIKVPDNATLTLTFNNDGSLVTGVKGTNYYEDGLGLMYTISAKASGSAIDVIPTLVTDRDSKANGVQWTSSFLYVYKNADGDEVVSYFVDGEMVKSAALPFGNDVLVFDKNGYLVTATVAADAVKVDGVKYIADSEKAPLIAGVPFSKIVE